MALIIDILKNERAQKSVWTEVAAKNFSEIEDNLTSALALALLDFNKLFKIDYDACGVGFGGVLSQVSKPITYFSDKLNDARQKLSIYEKELYAVFRAFKIWEH